MKRLRLGAAPLDQSLVVHSLGACLPTQIVNSPCSNPRIQDAQVVAKRLVGVPLPFYARACLLESLVLPRALYSGEAVRLQTAQLKSLRLDVLKVLLGGKRDRTCAEVLFTLLCPGHRLDPQQACIYRRLTTWKKMVDRRADLLFVLIEMWRPNFGRTFEVCGPMALIGRALASLGWQWLGPFLVANADGSTTDIRHVDREKWQHDIREAMRAKEWQHAEARRSNLHGIGHGINRDASTAVLLGGRLGPKKDGMLRAIISDGVWTQERKFRASLVDSPVCVH